MAQLSSTPQIQHAQPVSNQKVRDFLAYFPMLTDVDLTLHESKNPPSLPGGHTLFKHVNVTDADLQTRLSDESSTPAVSRFTDLDTAHAAIIEAIAVNFHQVLKWATSSKKGVSVSHRFNYPIGVVFERDTPGIAKVADGIVINFLKDSSGVYPLENSILTSYLTLEDRT